MYIRFKIRYTRIYMLRTINALITVLCFTFCVFGQDGDRRQYIRVDAPLIALTSVRIIDGTGAAPLEDQTILISGGKIEVPHFEMKARLELVLVLGAAQPLVPALGVPLFPLQLLWINLLTDGLPALALGIAPPDKDLMQRPPRDPQKAILSSGFLASIGFHALLITAVTLGAFLWALDQDGGHSAHAVTVAFMTLALAQTFHLGNARGGVVLGWRRVTDNPWALGAVALTVSLQFAAVYFPPLARVLDVAPPAARDWLVILPAALLPALIGQLLAARRRHRSAA